MGSGCMSSPWRSWRCRCRSLANTRGGWGGRDAGVGVCRFLLRIHPTDGRSSASCLCMKESIDGSNGLSWHPYAFVWRSSEGVRGNLRAGPDRMGRIALRGGRPGLLRTKTEKLRGGHEGVRIGPPAGRVGRGRASMADARRAGARRRFRNRRFRYVTRAAGRGQRCRNGGNLEGTGNRGESKRNPGNRMISTVSGVQIRAEDTRFELVRLLHQHAFQACAIDH